MSKIEKTIARQKQKIEEGQFYEAHQQLRVIASRYNKAENHDAAIDILSGGASLLLKAGQGGSGGDLCMFLMNVYKQAEVRPDAASKGRLLGLLRAFPAQEPTKKRFAGEVIAWSARFGEFPAGDPELHHVVGQMCAEDRDAYEAERHLTLGTKDSAQVLARMEYEWYAEDEPHTAALYAARAIFPPLLVGNLRAANTVLLLFTTQLAQTHPSLAVQEVGSSSCDMRIYPSLPLLNFLSLLLLAITRGNASTYSQLSNHYKSQLREVEGWEEPLQLIAQSYFGIRAPRQGNPLMDMLGGMFGPSASAPAAPRPRQSKVEAPPPAALD